MIKKWRSRQPAGQGDQDYDQLSRPDSGNLEPTSPLLQLQRNIGNQAVLRVLRGRATASIEDAIHSPGEPLQEPARSQVESQFGRDLSDVRIHTGARAAASAEAVHARAYTVGNDIAYSAGTYDPNTFAGRELLAHELTHVAQQPAGNASGPKDNLLISEPSDAAEIEAHSLSGRVAAGGTARPSVTGSNILARDQAVSTPLLKGPDAAPQQTKPVPEPADMTARLDKIAQSYHEMIAASRKKGYNVAADNLQCFLDGAGGTRKLGVPWLRGFGEVTEAEHFNQKRFEDSLSKQAKAVSHGDKKSFEDYWDKMLTAGRTTELYFASGTSTIRSKGKFDLDGLENLVHIGGTGNHDCFDPYDWHEGLGAYVPGFGNISDEDALLLQKYRGAKPFMMEADWRQSVSATYTHNKYWFDSSDYTWSGP